MGERSGFCEKCGNGTGNNGWGQAGNSYTICVREKSTGIAAILSLLWAGLGQLYVGKIARGLGLMLVHFMMVFIIASVVFAGMIFVGIGGGLMFGGIILAAWIAVWVWNIFDAHKLANEYNDSQRNAGRRPW
jgi:TM2 domain-containing membrane protein YozV